MLRRPIAAVILALALALAAVAGCERGPSFTWSDDSPVEPLRVYPSATITEERERLRDSQPLRHHADEASLRRHEYERDFYNGFYETRREQQRPAGPPRPSLDDID